MIFNYYFVWLNYWWWAEYESEHDFLKPDKLNTKLWLSK
jgi:hypothetical protein